MRYLIILILMPALQFTTSYLLKSLSFIQNNFWSTHFLIFAQQIFALAIPTLLVYKKQPYLPKKEFQKITPNLLVRFVLLGIVLQFLGIAVNAPVRILLEKLGGQLPSSFPNPKNTLQFLMQIIILCVSPAIFEEVFFRRFLLGSLQKYSRLVAIFGSAFFFATAHFNFANLAATFFIGVILGFVRNSGAPLFLCMITHFFVNFTGNLLDVSANFPVISIFLSHYFWLLVVFCAILLIALLPKQKIKSTSYSTLRAKLYCKKLFSNPLFYIYTVIFIVLGVRNL